MKTKLSPFDDRVVVKKTAVDMIGRIIIPDRVKNQSLEGEVVELGASCSKVKLGDKVLFGRYSGWEVPLDSYRNCLMMNEGDILGTIEETEEKDG